MGMVYDKEVKDEKRGKESLHICIYACLYQRKKILGKK